MNLKHYLIAAAVLALLPMPSIGAEGQATAKAPPAEEKVFQPAFGQALAQTDACDLCSDEPYRAIVARFGYWAMSVDGNPVKIGEFQSLESSPFWEVDGLSSDGNRTFDFYATGLDQEASQARLNFYGGPGLSAKLYFDRYLRRLDRDQFDNFDPDAPPPPAAAAQRVLNHNVISGDLDYAFRVRDFDTKFKGEITDNLKWRFNVWGIQRDGVRQAQKLAHCFNASAITPGAPTGNRCHILAQPQRIEWTTVEFEPGLEAKIGDRLAVDYSRTMRALGQQDQVVTRQYSNANHGSWPVAFTDVPYNMVTENYTQIDRLKLRAAVGDYTEFYGLGYIGSTKNEYRGTHRYLNGLDLRLTNTAVDGVTITGYGKRNNEHNRLPTTFPEADLIQGGDNIADYHMPVNYERTAAGLKGNWKPHDSGWDLPKGLAFQSGYEYSLIDRAYAEYEVERSALTQGGESRAFHQPSTIIHEIMVGTSMRWSACWDTFVRYKYRNITDPIYGLRATNGDVNTNQPTDVHLIELGGTWMPAENFMLSATFGIEDRTHHSQHENLNLAYDVYENGPRTTQFDETSYPLVVSAWYAPTKRLSLTGGYALYTNWIDQLVTLGDQWNDGVYSAPQRNYNEPQPFQSWWQYGSRAQVVNVGGAYCLTSRVSLNGNLEFGRSKASVYSNPWPATSADPSAGAAGTQTPDWSLIPTLSDVIVETTRATAGADYLLRDNVTVFARYNWYDWNDKGGTGLSGTMHAFLGGMSALF